MQNIFVPVTEQGAQVAVLPQGLLVSDHMLLVRRERVALQRAESAAGCALSRLSIGSLCTSFCKALAVASPHHLLAVVHLRVGPDVRHGVEAA